MNESSVIALNIKLKKEDNKMDEIITDVEALAALNVEEFADSKGGDE